MKSVLDFARAKGAATPICMVTAYDALMARIAVEAGIDALLMGDSVAMVVHGHESTIHADLAMMELHTRAVRRGAPDAFVVADMPFLTHRVGIDSAIRDAGTLMRAGASAVKIEGLAGHADVVARIVESGIPVMGHLGLTPQSVHQFGGYRLQARSPAEAAKLEEDANRLEKLGAFALVLECVPEATAGKVTEALSIPTIGIGSGAGTSGQILVMTDLLGMDDQFRPKFARRYADGASMAHDALAAYVADVRACRFPARQEVLA
jgi:3-methyl-2-oxobutanoate hydroxymethyltransferase